MDIKEVKKRIVERCSDISNENCTMRIFDDSIQYMLLGDCSIIHYIRSPHIFEQLFLIVRNRIYYERHLAENKLLKIKVLNYWLDDYDIIENFKY